MFQLTALAEVIKFKKKNIITNSAVKRGIDPSHMSRLDMFSYKLNINKRNQSICAIGRSPFSGQIISLLLTAIDVDFLMQVIIVQKIP